MGRLISDENKELLRHIIDNLTELVNDDKREVTDVHNLMHSATCGRCSDYGDQLFETITIVSEKK